MIKTKRVGPANEIMEIDLTEFKGRSFFSTDLHGCYDLLHEKLRDVSFNSEKDISAKAGGRGNRTAKEPDKERKEGNQGNR